MSSDLKQQVADIFKLLRWQNLIFLCILMWCMEKWVAVPVLGHIGFPEVLPWWLLLLLTLGVVLIAAGGYVINDYFDVKIDRINRPDRLIITNTVDKDRAMRLFQILTVAGLLCGLWAAYQVRSLSLAIVFLLVPGLLWFYSASYKRMFLVGNLIIALAAGLTPLTIALANVAWLTRHYAMVMPYMPLSHDLYCWLGGFSAFAFLCTLIREITKDLQDQEGDRELECHTLPICLGDVPTKIILTCLVLGTMALLCWCQWGGMLPFPTNWASPSVRYLIFGLLTSLTGYLALIWSAKIPSDYRSSQQQMKFVMFIGTLYSYIIASILS